jgi:hypothetical protein
MEAQLTSEQKTQLPRMADQTGGSSQIGALDIDFEPIHKQLDGLGNLEWGWDGYDAPKPSPEAIDAARSILEKMQGELVKPVWISASADGGVAFTFAAGGIRRAQVEVLNNGERFAHLYDLNGNSHTEDWAEALEGKSIIELAGAPGPNQGK